MYAVFKCSMQIKDKSGYMIHGFNRDNNLFQLFEEYRGREASQSHILAVNYSNQNYFLDNQVRFFIGFRDNKPVLFSSIFRLDWWPVGAYRILNRLWKPEKDDFVTKDINPLFFEMVEEQVNWLSLQQDFKVAVVSRQGNSKKYLEYFAEQNRLRGVDMRVFNSTIKTCKGPDCDCLQHVAYVGDAEILKRWPT